MLRHCPGLARDPSQGLAVKQTACRLSQAVEYVPNFSGNLTDGIQLGRIHAEAFPESTLS
jgi:hypothetical protein